MVLVVIITLIVAATVIAVAANLIQNPGRFGLHEATAVELHRIRRRIEVAFFRAQVTADANRMRHELDRELDKLQAK